MLELPLITHYNRERKKVGFLNVFQQLVKSLYSPKDVAKFRFQGIGKTILYVFLLALLTLIPTMISLWQTVSAGIQAVNETIEEEIPNFTIENGRLQSDTQELIVIEEPGFTIYFDASGETTLADIREDSALLISKEEASFITGGQVDAVPYSMFEGVPISKDEISNILTGLGASLPVLLGVLFFVIYVFSSGTAFVQISLFALIGLLFKKSLGRKLRYGQLWRLTAYSITLSSVFFAIVALFGAAVPFPFFLDTFVSLLFLYLVIKEIPAPKSKKVEAS